MTRLVQKENFLVQNSIFAPTLATPGSLCPDYPTFNHCRASNSAISCLFKGFEGPQNSSVNYISYLGFNL